MDEEKVEAITNWPQHLTFKALRAFLGLTGHYRRFVSNFGKIAQPLTAVLKKISFQWLEEALDAFVAFKQALVQAPVLQIPNFSKKSDRM